MEKRKEKASEKKGRRKCGEESKRARNDPRVSKTKGEKNTMKKHQEEGRRYVETQKTEERKEIKETKQAKLPKRTATQTQRESIGKCGKIKTDLHCSSGINDDRNGKECTAAGRRGEGAWEPEDPDPPVLEVDEEARAGRVRVKDDGCEGAGERRSDGAEGNDEDKEEEGKEEEDRGEKGRALG